jgi:RNA polymerase sigma-70 factor (ECF subfamily)
MEPAQKQDGGTDLADLVRRVAAGQSDAEQALLSTMQGPMRVLVRRHARPNDPDLDDLLQDALRILLERVRSGALRDPDALYAYAQSIVLNTVTAWYRKASNKAVSEAADALAGQADPGPSPEAQLAREQTDARVATLLESLPVQRDREVLRLFYLQELDRAEVCVRMSIDELHFHRVMHRARKRLGVMLGRTEPDEAPW